MFDDCKFKFWCFCLSFWILLRGILFFCVHVALLTVGKVANFQKWVPCLCEVYAG
jgi:hypothetical protein